MAAGPEKKQIKLCAPTPREYLSGNPLSLGPFKSQTQAQTQLAAELKNAATFLAAVVDTECSDGECNKGCFCTAVGDGIDESKIIGPVERDTPVKIYDERGKVVRQHDEKRWWYDIPARTKIKYHCECQAIPPIPEDDDDDDDL